MSFNELMSPEVTSTRPSGRIVPVGYHLRNAIEATLAHAAVAGLNRLTSVTPNPPPVRDHPPMAIIRPSGKNV